MNTKNSITTEIHTIKNISISDFCVEEYDGAFQILRKIVAQKTTGFLWWKKKTEEINWYYVDNWGHCLTAFSKPICRNTFAEKMAPFTDLKSAFDKIDTIITGAKTHYR